MSLYKVSTFSFIALLLGGCFSVTNMQNGRTLGKDNADIAGSINLVEYEHLKYDSTSASGKYYLPSIECRVSLGLIENLDFFLKVNSSVFIGPGLKFQFLGNKKSIFAASIGAEAGANPLTFMVGRSWYYTSVPLYMSLHPKENLAFYLTPRHIYVYDYISPQVASGPTEKEITNNFGFSYGVMFGKKNKLAIDVSSFNKGNIVPSQISVGYIYNFEDIY